MQPPGLSRVIGVTKGAVDIWSAEVCDAVAILECTRWSLKPGATWPKGQQWWAQETDGLGKQTLPGGRGG